MVKFPLSPARVSLDWKRPKSALENGPLPQVNQRYASWPRWRMGASRGEGPAGGSQGEGEGAIPRNFSQLQQPDEIHNETNPIDNFQFAVVAVRKTLDFRFLDFHFICFVVWVSTRHPIKECPKKKPQKGKKRKASLEIATRREGRGNQRHLLPTASAQVKQLFNPSQINHFNNLNNNQLPSIIMISIIITTVTENGSVITVSICGPCWNLRASDGATSAAAATI